MADCVTEEQVAAAITVALRQTPIQPPVERWLYRVMGSIISAGVIWLAMGVHDLKIEMAKVTTQISGEIQPRHVYQAVSDLKQQVITRVEFDRLEDRVRALETRRP